MPSQTPPASSTTNALHLVRNGSPHATSGYELTTKLMTMRAHGIVAHDAYTRHGQATICMQHCHCYQTQVTNAAAAAAHANEVRGLLHCVCKRSANLQTVLQLKSSLCGNFHDSSRNACQACYLHMSTFMPFDLHVRPLSSKLAEHRLVR